MSGSDGGFTYDLGATLRAVYNSSLASAPAEVPEEHLSTMAYGISGMLLINLCVAHPEWAAQVAKEFGFSAEQIESVWEAMPQVPVS